MAHVDPHDFHKDQEMTADYRASLEKVADDFSRDNPSFTRKQMNQFINSFAMFDVDRSGDLDLHEVHMMMEKLGQTKTHMELKEMIKEVDHDNSGTINFQEFLVCMAPRKFGTNQEEPLPLFGRIYQSALAERAKFFEERMRAARGKTPEQLQREIKEEAERRRLERIRQKEEAEERAAAERKAAEDAVRRAEFQAKLGKFQQH